MTRCYNDPKELAGGQFVSHEPDDDTFNPTIRETVDEQSRPHGRPSPRPDKPLFQREHQSTLNFFRHDTQERLGG